VWIEQNVNEHQTSNAERTGKIFTLFPICLRHQMHTRLPVPIHLWRAKQVWCEDDEWCSTFLIFEHTLTPIFVPNQLH